MVGEISYHTEFFEHLVESHSFYLFPGLHITEKGTTSNQKRNKNQVPRILIFVVQKFKYYPTYKR